MMTVKYKRMIRESQNIYLHHSRVLSIERDQSRDQHLLNGLAKKLFLMPLQETRIMTINKIRSEK